VFPFLLIPYSQLSSHPRLPCFRAAQFHALRLNSFFMVKDEASFRTILISTVASARWK
jgi:hypothetical protein